MVLILIIKVNHYGLKDWERWICWWSTLGIAAGNKSIFAAVADTNFINKFPGPATPGIYSLDGMSENLIGSLLSR